jgi:N-acetyl sugar amidotransferase
MKFNENGVCYPCVNAEKSKSIDWKRRFKELKKLCDKYRKPPVIMPDGEVRQEPDCIITASGGKDSHVQVKIFREQLDMHPLVCNVFNLSWTNTGWLNFNNMLEKYRVHCESLHLSPSIARNLMRKAFFRYGSPTWFWDRCVYSWPLQVALRWKIPLVVYGENIAYTYGGPEAKETYSAKDQMKNDVVKPIPLEEWMDDEITPFDLHPAVMPSEEEIEQLEPIYLSYFFKWDGFKNYTIASNDGFKSLSDTGEWTRQGYVEDYDQIDSAGYLVHPWLKYPKFGHARTTDVCSNLIRNGYITREYAVELVKAHDHKLDERALQDFLHFTQINAELFYKTLHKIYNRDIFDQMPDGTWKLKHPIWEEKDGRHEDTAGGDKL